MRPETRLKAEIRWLQVELEYAETMSRVDAQCFLASRRKVRRLRADLDRTEKKLKELTDAG